MLLLAWWIIFPIHAIAQECSIEQVDLRGSFGQVRFAVSVVDTPASRAQGLMDVSNLPQREGMLFVYSSPESVSFWMKNTLIPLDMLFANGKGEIILVHHNARPLDETTIFGGNNVQYVLEINAGLSKRYGINVGSQMRHPSISDNASWACK
jgi:uncharacterized membrane protein (UPF0127 family)